MYEEKLLGLVRRLLYMMQCIELKDLLTITVTLNWNYVWLVHGLSIANPLTEVLGHTASSTPLIFTMWETRREY